MAFSQKTLDIAKASGTKGTAIPKPDIPIDKILRSPWGEETFKKPGVEARKNTLKSFGFTEGFEHESGLKYLMSTVTKGANENRVIEDWESPLRLTEKKNISEKVLERHAAESQLKTKRSEEFKADKVQIEAAKTQVKNENKYNSEILYSKELNMYARKETVGDIVGKMYSKLQRSGKGAGKTGGMDPEKVQINANALSRLADTFRKQDKYVAGIHKKTESIAPKEDTSVYTGNNPAQEHFKKYQTLYKDYNAYLTTKGGYDVVSKHLNAEKAESLKVVKENQAIRQSRKKFSLQDL